MYFVGLLVSTYILNYENFFMLNENIFKVDFY